VQIIGIFCFQPVHLCIHLQKQSGRFDLDRCQRSAGSKRSLTFENNLLGIARAPSHANSVHLLARETVSLAERALWPKPVSNLCEESPPSSKRTVSGRGPAETRKHSAKSFKRYPFLSSGNLRKQRVPNVCTKRTKRVPQGPAYPRWPPPPILPEPVIFQEVSCRCLDHSSGVFHFLWPSPVFWNRLLMVRRPVL
jgi:hypothetical protein